MSTAHSPFPSRCRFGHNCVDRETLLATVFLVALLIGQASAATGHAPLLGPAVNGVRRAASQLSRKLCKGENRLQHSLAGQIALA
jgi:hypothetical protein